jgi:hypothetical protein
MNLLFLIIPEPTMTQNEHSSPIITFDLDEFVNGTPEPATSPITAFIPDDDVDRSVNSDSSGMAWLWPENQLGLELEDQVALDKKGEFQAS